MLYRFLPLSLCLFFLALLLQACGDKGGASTEGKPNSGLQVAVDGARFDTLRVATLNMSVGWRAEELVMKDLADSSEVFAMVRSLYSQFVASQPGERIRVMAKEVVAHPVDVLALQEVQVIRFDDGESFHYLDTLLFVLDSLEGGRFWQVARQQINRVDADVRSSDGERAAVEFWEGQATLVRSSFAVTDVDSAIFAKRVTFPILAKNFSSERGFVRVAVTSPHGGLWLLYNTHLEVELLSLFNTPQGIELNSRVWDDWLQMESGAQVVLGDLNSFGGMGGLGALTSPGSGLLDAWSVLHGPETPAAFTCCVVDLANVEGGGYDRRLDYILVRDVLAVTSMESLPLRGERVWGGDHALVRAVLVRQL